MKNEYILLLPIERARSYRLVIGIILLMNFLAFGYLLLNRSGVGGFNFPMYGTVFTGVILINYIRKAYTKVPMDGGIEFIFLILGLGWVLFSKYLFGFCLLLFSLLAYHAFRKIKIIISERGISLSTFPSKFYFWKVISNVVLKDDMLTIDLKNNKLIQSVLDPESDQVDESEFNLYCNRQIENA